MSLLLLGVLLTVTWKESPLSSAGQSSQMCVTSPVRCAQGRDSAFLLYSSRPVVDVVTELSFSPEEIPVHEVECSYSASQEQKEGVKLNVCFQIRPLTPQFLGRCQHAPRRAAPNPAWGRSPITQLLPSSLPRSPACQPQLHPAAGWPPDEEPRCVPRRKPRAQWKHICHPR